MWATFLTEIKDADVDVIQDKAKREKEKKEVEKAQNARIARLESRQTDPVEVLWLQMQQVSLQTVPAQTRPNTTAQSNPNVNLQARRQIRYVTASQNTQGPCPQNQPPTQEERDLMRTRINKLVHHPDTRWTNSIRRASTPMGNTMGKRRQMH